jgi:hypothetical protein
MGVSKNIIFIIQKEMSANVSLFWQIMKNQNKGTTNTKRYQILIVFSDISWRIRGRDCSVSGFLETGSSGKPDACLVQAYPPNNLSVYEDTRQQDTLKSEITFKSKIKKTAEAASFTVVCY